MNNIASHHTVNRIKLGNSQSSSSTALSMIQHPGTLSRHISQNASDYHILLPDLPSHGIANDIKSFFITIAAHLITELIARRARNGVAKLVGLSLGADVALRIA